MCPYVEDEKIYVGKQICNIGHGKDIKQSMLYLS